MNGHDGRWGAILALVLLAAPSWASEQWIVAADLWGNRLYQTLELEAHGSQLQGRLDADPVQGTRNGNAITFTATGADGRLYRFDGRVDGARMQGRSTRPDPNDADVRAAHIFDAWRVPVRTSTAAQTHVFVPHDYANTFSADRAPALLLWPGDSVRTQTLDSGGVDSDGTTRALFGNPQVGPFFIVGAEPGDMLAVHLVALRLNRETADSLDGLVGRLQTPYMATQVAGLGKHVRWRLDRDTGLARPLDAEGPMRTFAVPVRPMLGGLAVAPGFGNAALSTGDTGVGGGNMDFNAVMAGSTVYLPVQQPGALLYLGDGHAVQGDGETTQWALETSLDVEFRIELVKRHPIAMPRVESPEQIAVLGQAGSSDDALRLATSGLLRWLQQDYGLSLAQATQVLGVAARYRVANLAGRSVGVAASIDKAVLHTLQPPASPASNQTEQPSAK
ncbi:acetamidase [Xanthomonas sp. LMG 8992]|uniref:acetamidase/formamidase family protein n=1 Tax=Xanthomonas sp. LMG 8992 TaxID=1591157 RepID=UPI00136A06ED|nr:acetamidase/formamidase family protein [Xanthomonas sp. LMG 8992]MXV11158.1 acetamidase [Xanthomonas sp. LMG 8992]